MVSAGTLCDDGDVSAFAGANVNVTALGDPVCDIYILAAESIIANATGYDWVANYATVSAAKKEILREAAGTWSAMKVIGYDMTGASAREMETRLDILHASFNRALELLKKEGRE